MDGIVYLVRTGCAWRYLPADLPPWQTVYWYFKQWEEAKVTEAMLAALREQARIQQGRNPQPSAGIIDSQSVKGADTIGRDSRGYDAGKRINGGKRFIVIDTLSLLIVVVVLAASVQDRDGAKTTLLSQRSGHTGHYSTSRSGRMTMVLTVPSPQTVVFSSTFPSRESMVNSGTNRSVNSPANPLRSAGALLSTRSHSAASRTRTHA